MQIQIRLFCCNLWALGIGRTNNDKKVILSKETIKKCNTEYRYNCSNISSDVPIAFFLNAVTFNINFWSLNFQTGLQRTITVHGR